MAKKRLKIGVLAGGPSSEHEVSLATGENVYRSLDRSRFRPVRVVLGKNWQLHSEGKKLDFPLGLKRFDLIFNALHGAFGEDGTLQRILDHIGVTYTGSQAVASWLGMDKWLSHQIFKKNGFATPLTELVTNREPELKLGFPLFLKPRRGGSSLGVELVKSKRLLRPRLRSVFNYDEHAIAQEYLKKREFTCGILEIGGKLRALPVIEIRPGSKSNFFDYQAKYTESGAEEIVPAPISVKLTRRIQDAALKAHRIIGCSGYSRSDFILRNNQPYILEINTLPGLTETSLLPKAALAAGISFAKLLDLIILSAIRSIPKNPTKVKLVIEK